MAMNEKPQKWFKLVKKWPKSVKNFKKCVHMVYEFSFKRFDIAGVKAEASGFNVFVNSMQDHIQDLTLNMTMVHGNMTNMETDVNTIEMGMEAMADQITNVKSNVSEMTVQMGSNKEEIKGELIFYFHRRNFHQRRGPLHSAFVVVRHLTIIALGTNWGRTGNALGMHLGHTGDALRKYWRRIGDALRKHWKLIEKALETQWGRICNFDVWGTH